MRRLQVRVAHFAAKKPATAELHSAPPPPRLHM
jgi:hypothetical protein